MFNWTVRFKNKTWVIAFLSQIMIVAQVILDGTNRLGLTSFQLTQEVQNEVLIFANTLFIILSLLGIVQDPTTKGYSDSENALTYKEPK